MTLRLDSGTVTIDGEYALGTLTDELVTAIFNTTPLDNETYLPEIAVRLSPQDRQALYDYCMAAPALKQCWVDASFYWSGLTNESGWDLSKFTIVFDRTVNTSLIGRVVITSTGHRFTVSGKTVLSFAEFYYTHGIAVSEHLIEHAQEQQAYLECIASVAKTPLAVRSMTVADKHLNIGTVKATGVSTTPGIYWTVPDAVCVDPGELVGTVPLRYKEHEC